MTAPRPMTADCPRCGTPVPDAALACVSCHRLVHADLLGELARQAQASETAGDLSAALTVLRQMRDLVPSSTRQAAELDRQIVALSGKLDGLAPAPEGARSTAGWGALAATILALLWKGKFLVLFALTKGKVLLLGLTKLPTLLSMFLTIGIYTTILGWPFAVGIVVSIYIHEMGHVMALTRYGIAASAPMFVPGLGAFVRLHQYPATPREDATVGLAGPLWGLATALVAAGFWVFLDSPLMGAIARVGAWINLFNLLPVWQLDGARGWRALDRAERWICVAALIVAWAISEDTLVFVVALVAGFRALTSTAPATGDRKILVTYVGLALTLALLLAWLPSPSH